MQKILGGFFLNPTVIRAWYKNIITSPSIRQARNTMSIEKRTKIKTLATLVAAFALVNMVQTHTSKPNSIVAAARSSSHSNENSGGSMVSNLDQRLDAHFREIDAVLSRSIDLRSAVQSSHDLNDDSDTYAHNGRTHEDSNSQNTSGNISNNAHEGDVSDAQSDPPQSLQQDSNSNSSQENDENVYQQDQSSTHDQNTSSSSDSSQNSDSSDQSTAQDVPQESGSHSNSKHSDRHHSKNHKKNKNKDTSNSDTSNSGTASDSGSSDSNSSDTNSTDSNGQENMNENQDQNSGQENDTASSTVTEDTSTTTSSDTSSDNSNNDGSQNSNDNDMRSSSDNSNASDTSATSTDNSQEPAADTSNGSGMVSIDFDDGWSSGFEKGAPILEAAGYKGTYFIISSAVGESNYMSWSDIASLEQGGNEIGDHTRNHLDQRTVSDSTEKSDIDNGFNDLQSHGITPESLAYPYGHFDSASEQDARNDGMTSARGSVSEFALNDQNTDPYALHAQSLDNTTTFEEVKSNIDEAIKEGKWYIITLHGIDQNTNDQYSISSDLLQQIVDYLKANNVNIVTNSQGVSELNNQ
jgi:peptidoglycan/xylan/chitin deacetylase (PgdA/CDA1 family)